MEDRPLRILVTGASGLLGREIMKELTKNSRWEVRGLCSSRASETLVRCDLTEYAQLESQFTEFAPDAVIHAAAERRPDVVFKQPEIAHALNIDVTRNLANACCEHNAWMMFFSTDYVFDGHDPPYATDAQPSPLSAYGEQKVSGEKICIETCSTSTVLRVPLLYGPMESMKESGVTAMYDEFKKGSTKADNLQKRYPTYTCDLARIVHKMLDVQFSGMQVLSGIYHWQADECLTKYDMVQVIGSIVGVDASHITANMTAPKFPTPPDSKLDCSRLETDLGILGPAANEYRTPFKEALANCFATYISKDLVEPVPHRPTIKQADATHVLHVLGASRRLSASMFQHLNSQGEIDTEDFNQLLGSPMRREKGM